MYGEQLMDVLSSHQLRPAHLNLIYNRLAQMGAEVEQTPEQSCEGARQAAGMLSVQLCTLHHNSGLHLTAATMPPLGGYKLLCMATSWHMAFEASCFPF